MPDNPATPTPDGSPRWVKVYIGFNNKVEVASHDRNEVIDSLCVTGLDEDEPEPYRVVAIDVRLPFITDTRASVRVPDDADPPIDVEVK